MRRQRTEGDGAHPRSDLPYAHSVAPIPHSGFFPFRVPHSAFRIPHSVVASKDDAIEWIKRAPIPAPGTEPEIEIRQIFEADDFGDEFTPELREQDERIRAPVGTKK